MIYCLNLYLLTDLLPSLFDQLPAGWWWYQYLWRFRSTNTNKKIYKNETYSCSHFFYPSITCEVLECCESQKLPNVVVRSEDYRTLSS